MKQLLIGILAILFLSACSKEKKPFESETIDYNNDWVIYAEMVRDFEDSSLIFHDLFGKKGTLYVPATHYTRLGAEGLLFQYSQEEGMKTIPFPNNNGRVHKVKSGINNGVFFLAVFKESTDFKSVVEFLELRNGELKTIYSHKVKKDILSFTHDNEGHYYMVVGKRKSFSQRFSNTELLKINETGVVETFISPEKHSYGVYYMMLSVDDGKLFAFFNEDGKALIKKYDPSTFSLWVEIEGAPGEFNMIRDSTVFPQEGGFIVNGEKYQIYGRSDYGIDFYQFNNNSWKNRGQSLYAKVNDYFFHGSDFYVSTVYQSSASFYNIWDFHREGNFEEFSRYPVKNFRVFSMDGDVYAASDWGERVILKLKD